MPKSRAERVLSRRLLILGLLLTLVAVALDYLGVLRALDGWFYDRRVRNFQFSAPPPNDRFVHLDIDEQALQVAGRWPWDRVVLADMIDEVRRAGAKVVALDVVFPDPQEPGPHPREKPMPDWSAAAAAAAAATQPTTAPVQVLAWNGRRIVDHDAEFARALAGGKAVLPVSFQFDPPNLPQAHFVAVMDEIGGHLETTFEQLNLKLDARHLPAASQDEYKYAMEEWTRRALAPLLVDEKMTFEAACQKLLHDDSENPEASMQGRLLKARYAKAVAERAMRRLFHLVPEGLPKMLQPTEELLPIPRISQAASDSGFVDWLRERDAVIRSMPLFADFNGQLVPQFGLAIACAYLDIRPDELKILPDRVIVPRRGQGSDVVIPMHLEKSAIHGERGMFFDIPFVGGEEWLRMYDHPNHTEVKQHHSAAAVVDISDMRRRIERNNRKIDEAILKIYFVSENIADKRKTIAYKAHPLDPDNTAAREPFIKDALDQPAAQQVLQEFTTYTPERIAKLDVDEFNIYTAVKVLRPDGVPAENAKLIENLKKQESWLRDQVKDKVVFIGWAAEATTDFVTTSMHSTCPGGVVHATIFNAIITNYFWRRFPWWVTLFCTLLLGGATTFTASTLRPLAAAPATTLVGGAFVAVNIVLFGYQRRLLGFAGPMTAWLLVWSVIPIARYFFEAGVRARIQKRFSTYVDPALVNYLLEHPEKLHLDGELREMTVVFTDLVGFTSLAEEMREAAVRLLGEYMALMVPLIRAHHGFVSKFIGDGLMFFYGAPQNNPHHAADAVETVVEMQRAMKEFAESVKRRGLKELFMRAGVNSATMIVGDAGMETAADYTPLGDGMNLGSRLEGANKVFGTRILISGRTVFLCDGKYLVRRIANIVVKGKREAVMAHEPLGLAEKASDEQRRLVDMTNAMVDAYVAGDFKKCLDAASKLDEAFPTEKTLVVKYRELCEHYLAHPPEQFNGTILLSEK
jgi:class 3 adenylate cyclase/CHASE2 domain-containing sensor protein